MSVIGCRFGTLAEVAVEVGLRRGGGLYTGELGEMWRSGILTRIAGGGSLTRARIVLCKGGHGLNTTGTRYSENTLYESK